MEFKEAWITGLTQGKKVKNPALVLIMSNNVIHLEWPNENWKIEEMKEQIDYLTRS